MDIFQILASMASIISIPLAIYYSHKSNITSSEKARLDIIKTLSYRLSSTHNLTYDDIDSVYKSKLREHKISHTTFNKNDILNDLKTDIMSNAFLGNDLKTDILYNLSTIELSNRSLPLHINKLIKLFLSPLFEIYLIMGVIMCIIYFSPYIFNMVSFYILNGFLSVEYLSKILDQLCYDSKLHIALIFLLIFSVICFFKKDMLDIILIFNLLI